MRFASRRVWLAPILLLAAFVVRVIGLDAQSFWYDEGYSVMFVRHSLGHVVGQAGPLELNTPLYYVVLFVWTRLAGDSEFSARLVSVFAGLLTVALVAPLASRIAGRPAGLWALAFIAVWPVNVAVSQEARMYALVTLLAFASCVALVTRCLREDARPVDWVVWAGLCIAAFSAHVLAAFIIAAQVVVILARLLASHWRARRAGVSGIWRVFRIPVLAISAIALITGVWTLWLLSFRAAYGTSFSDPLDLSQTLMRSAASLVLPRNLPESLIPHAVALTSVIVLGLLMIASPQAHAVMVVSLIGLIGIAAFCALTGKYAARYSAIVAPLLVAGMGVTFGGATSRRARLALPAGLVCLTLAALGMWAWRADPLYANEDFRGAAAFVRAQARPDERVVLVSGHFAPVFAYYYGDTGWIAVPDDPVLDISHVLDYDLAAPYLNRELAGASGAWLLEWQQDVIDPTHIVAELLRRQAQGRAYQEIAGFHNLRLRHFRFAQPYQPMPSPVPLQSRVDADAGPARGLGALGCHVFDSPRAGDATLEVACFWTLARFSGLPLDTRVSLRLVNSAGAWVAQSDQYLAAPYGLPNATVDKSLAAFYVMEIPPDLPAGPYTLQAVPYTRAGPEETLEIAPRVYTPARIAPGAR